MEGEAPGPIWKRLAWLVGIWAASILALGAVAAVLKAWLGT